MYDSGVDRGVMWGSCLLRPTGHIIYIKIETTKYVLAGFKFKL